MVVCKKCGNENPLGRVFCTKCGTKLDLTHMTSEHVTEIQKSWSDPFVKYWPKAVAAVVIIVLILVGLSLWPDTGVIGKKGTRVDGSKVNNVLASLKSVRANEPLKKEFKEEEINGYFEFFKTKSMNMDSISVSVQDGYFFVRVIKPLRSVPLIKVEVKPVMTYDLVCVPYGGGVRVTTAKIGHLSMFGPLKSMAVNKMFELFSSQQEWANLSNISDVKCAVGKISIQATKK